MRDTKDLRKFCNEFAHDQLLLCTIVGKSGSSYRGPGAKKVVRLLGGTQGFLSGGCLENAIDKFAREEFLLFPKTKNFSTAADEDRLMGYQTGCQGNIDVLFERLPCPLNEEEIKLRLSLEEMKLTLIGASVDSLPLIDLALNLGWSIQVLDYRKSLVENFSHTEVSAQLFRMEQIRELVPQGPRSAVVLMTHNYEADLDIIRNLVPHPISYLGAMGPATRWQHLKEDLRKFHHFEVPESWDSIVRAPAGIFKRGNSPAEIALSILAQIQEVIFEPKTQVSSKNWSLLLAAGESSRFGGSKALAKWNDRPIISEILRKAQGLNADRVMTVTGAYHEVLLPYLEGSHVVRNENWKVGMGTSLAKGFSEILKLDPQCESVTVLLVDQPLIEVQQLSSLQYLAKLTQRTAFTGDGESFGPPAVVPRKFFERVLNLKGERGLRSQLQKNEWVILGSEALADVDTQADYLRLRDKAFSANPGLPVLSPSDTNLN